MENKEKRNLAINIFFGAIGLIGIIRIIYDPGTMWQVTNLLKLTQNQQEQTENNQEQTVKVDSKYPFAETCSDMQDAYNKQYEKFYQEGRVKEKITFSLFGESRFRGDAYTDAGLCSKGVISISADTYDEICTNSNMTYIWEISKDNPVPKWDWGDIGKGSTQSCIRT